MSRIRVLNEYFAWEEGKMIIFDDSFDHEVWHFHPQNKSRLVLIIDMIHPNMPSNRYWIIGVSFSDIITNICLLVSNCDKRKTLYFFVYSFLKVDLCRENYVILIARRYVSNISHYKYDDYVLLLLNKPHRGTTIKWNLSFMYLIIIHITHNIYPERKCPLYWSV